MPSLATGPWSALEPGMLVQAPDCTLWDVDDVRDGWVRLLRSSYNLTGQPPLVIREERQVPPQPPDFVATIVIPSLEEAAMMVADKLGGAVVHRGRVEALAAWLARAPRMPVPHPKGAGMLRMHLAMLHAVHVAGMKPAELKERHAELHDGPSSHGRPHFHRNRA